MQICCLQQPTCSSTLQTTGIWFPMRWVSFITVNRISLDSNFSTDFSSSHFQLIFIICFHIISYSVSQISCAQGFWIPLWQGHPQPQEIINVYFLFSVNRVPNKAHFSYTLIIAGRTKKTLVTHLLVTLKLLVWILRSNCENVCFFIWSSLKYWCACEDFLNGSWHRPCWITASKIMCITSPAPRR